MPLLGDWSTAMLVLLYTGEREHLVLLPASVWIGALCLTTGLIARNEQLQLLWDRSCQYERRQMSFTKLDRQN